MAAVTTPVRQLRARSQPNGSADGALAGIEPVMTADGNVTPGSARRGHSESTHLHWECVALRAGSASSAEPSLATDEGDVGIDGARVWNGSSRSGGADCLPWRRSLSKGDLRRPSFSRSSAPPCRTTALSTATVSPLGRSGTGATSPSVVASGERDMVLLAPTPIPQPGRSRVQGRPLAERRAQDGGGPEDTYATARPTGTVVAPRSDP